VQAVQIFPSTASTTSEGFLFRENSLAPEAYTQITVEDLLGPLQDFLHSLGNVSDVLHSLDSAKFLTPIFLDQSRLTAQFNELRIEKITRNLVDSFLMGFLEGTAESEEESAFLSIAKAIDWTARPPEDLLRGLRLALRVGAFSLARELSTEGARRYPRNPELQKYACVLAPPKVVRSDLPPTPSVKANRNWLKEHVQRYKGRWVALQNGELKGVANSLEELVTQLGDTKGILLTRV
jgi:hypothetical protein